jgi:hypothetical protein
MLLTDCTASPADESVPTLAQRDPDAKVGSYSDGMFFDFISMINLYPAPADRVFCRGNV